MENKGTECAEFYRKRDIPRSPPHLPQDGVLTSRSCPELRSLQAVSSVLGGARKCIPQKKKESYFRMGDQQLDSLNRISEDGDQINIFIRLWVLFRGLIQI